MLLVGRIKIFHKFEEVYQNTYFMLIG